MSGINKLYKKYVGNLPPKSSDPSEEEDFLQEFLTPIEEPNVKEKIEMEEEAGIEM